MRISKGVDSVLCIFPLYMTGDFVAYVAVSFAGFFSAFWRLKNFSLFGYLGEQAVPEEAWGGKTLDFGVQFIIPALSLVVSWSLLNVFFVCLIVLFFS